MKFVHAVKCIMYDISDINLIEKIELDIQFFFFKYFAKSHLNSLFDKDHFHPQTFSFSLKKTILNRFLIYLLIYHYLI